MTGQSRGFGFIRFKTDEAAKNALIHNHTIQGRNVEVRLPRAKVIDAEILFCVSLNTKKA